MAERFNVTTTNYVPLTFDQIAVAKPDLLVIGLVWGEIAGWELLERLHSEAVTLGIPVILTSTNQKLLDRGAVRRDAVWRSSNDREAVRY